MSRCDLSIPGDFETELLILAPAVQPDAIQTLMGAIRVHSCTAWTLIDALFDRLCTEWTRIALMFAPGEWNRIVGVVGVFPGQMV